MPAKAGIQKYLKTLDSRLRGNDAKGRIKTFYESVFSFSQKKMNSKLYFEPFMKFFTTQKLLLRFPFQLPRYQIAFGTFRTKRIQVRIHRKDQFQAAVVIKVGHGIIADVT